MKLQINEDNSAQYRWTLVADDGHGLASSTEAFASYENALRAAEALRDDRNPMTIEARADQGTTEVSGLASSAR